MFGVGTKRSMNIADALMYSVDAPDLTIVQYCGKAA